MPTPANCCTPSAWTTRPGRSRAGHGTRHGRAALAFALDEAIAAASARSLEKLDSEVLTALRLGAYQLRYLSRIPAHAAINESVELVKRARKRSAAPFANAVLRKIAAAQDRTSVRCRRKEPPHLWRGEFAHPEWLVERWIAEFGSRTRSAICQHDQQVPARSCVSTKPSVKRTACEGIELAPGALLDERPHVVGGDVTRTRKPFRKAASSSRMKLRNWWRHWWAPAHACSTAAPLPAARLPQSPRAIPTAEIIAAEIHAHRAELLRKRVRAANVKVIQADASNLPA